MRRPGERTWPTSPAPVWSFWNPTPLTAFRGSVKLDPERPTKAFTTISEEVLTHLLKQPDIEAEVRVEVEIRNPEGFSEHTVQTVAENTQTLQFEEGSGFSET